MVESCRREGALDGKSGLIADPHNAEVGSLSEVEPAVTSAVGRKVDHWRKAWID